MKYVADDRRLQAVQRFLVFQNRDGIQQCLRGMLMHTVAGVDDGNIEMASHQVRSAGRWVPHHDAIGADGSKRVSGIEDGFSFFDT